MVWSVHGPLVSFFERDVLERLLCTVSARNGRVVECQSSPPRSCGDCQQSDVAKLARRMATRALQPTGARAVSAPCQRRVRVVQCAFIPMISAEENSSTRSHTLAAEVKNE